MLTFDKVHNPLRLPGETTSKRPNPWCFSHLNFEMCFAPQWRALFRHLNFQKWSKNGVLCTFWLRNVLRAKTARTFSTSQHSTSKTGSNRAVLLAFSLANVLRATRARTFSSSQLPKLVRKCGAFSFFTCKCASRHKGVHFFDISTSKAGPNVRCF